MLKSLSKLIVLVVVVAFLAVVGCPIYKITGITCPACGTTRAWLSLFGGNISQAFAYNPFFLLMPPFLVATVYIDDLKGKTKKWAMALLCTFAGIIFVYNIFRIAGVV